MQACTLQLAITVSCSTPKPVSMAALFIWRSTASLLHLCEMAFPSSSLVRWAKAAPSLFTSLSARCASRQGNQKGLARRKFLGPHSPPLPPSSCCQTHIVGQTQGWWQPLTNLPLAVTFASLPLDQWGTNIHASRWSLPIRRNLPPFLWVRDQQQLLCQRGYLSKHCGGWFSHPLIRSRVHCRWAL